jgi:hypothetical protein
MTEVVVNALMSAVDEAAWEQDGLFNVPDTPLTAQLPTSATTKFTSNTFHFPGASKTQRESLGNERSGPYLPGCAVSTGVNKNWGGGVDFQTGRKFLTTRQPTKRSWLPN